MINKVYDTLLTILNKEIQGYISPVEFNLLANNVQLQIFREYFEDENRDKNRENRGLTNKGYANLSFNQRQRIDEFADQSTISHRETNYVLPSNLYLLEEDGISTPSGIVVEEVERSQINYMRSSEVAPTELYAVYEMIGNTIKVMPASFTNDLEVRYLRVPKEPKWTYFTLPDSTPVFNPSSSDFQDFELHKSEFSNVVVRMLVYFGINLRESDVVQVAEARKDKNNAKDNG
jgi:hypothetical protein